MTRLIYRPLSRWDGPITNPRAVTPFSAGWGDTLKILDREVRHLIDMRHSYDIEIVVELDVAERDCRIDGGLRTDYRCPSPKVALSFDSRHGQLRYECDTYRLAQNGREGWQENVRAIALSLEALRSVSRWGLGRRGEQYTGWTAIGTGRPMGPAAMTREAAIALLETYASWATGSIATVDGSPRFAAVVTSAYRRGVKNNHPDAGGDGQLIRQLTEARDLLIGAQP